MLTTSSTTEHPYQHLVSLVISYSKGLCQFVEPVEQELLLLYTQGRFTLEEVVYSLYAHRAQHQLSAWLTRSPA